MGRDANAYICYGIMVDEAELSKLPWHDDEGGDNELTVHFDLEHWWLANKPAAEPQPEQYPYGYTDPERKQQYEQGRRALETWEAKYQPITEVSSGYDDSESTVVIAIRRTVVQSSYVDVIDLSKIIASIAEHDVEDLKLAAGWLDLEFEPKWYLVACYA
jgi:hypothetical protein